MLKENTDMPGVRGRPRKELLTPDIDWFKRKFRSIGLNQKEIAQAIGRHAAVLTRSLKGERRFDLDDVVKLANTLKVPLDEVARRLGYIFEARGTPIVGKVTGDGKVSQVTSRKGGFVATSDFPLDAVAYVAETEGSALAPYHGATFVTASGTGPAAPDVIGRLCIVEADDYLVPMLGLLGKAPSRGAVSLTVFGTGETFTLKAVHRASIVLAILFP